METYNEMLFEFYCRILGHKPKCQNYFKYTVLYVSAKRLHFSHVELISLYEESLSLS